MPVRLFVPKGEEVAVCWGSVAIESCELDSSVRIMVVKSRRMNVARFVSHTKK